MGKEGSDGEMKAEEELPQKPQEDGTTRMDDSTLTGAGSDDSDSTQDSDTTDTSDLDLDQCAERKADYLRQLCELERQFAVLKQQLFDEKLALLDGRLAGVKAGDAPEYVTPLRRLENSYRDKQQVALALRRFRLANSQHRYDAELLAAEQNLCQEREGLGRQMRQELEERLRRLEEDRRQVDISCDLWSSGDGVARLRSRSPHSTAQRGEDGRRRRRVTVSGPYIVYMLAEPDISDDWTVVKKALATGKRKDFKVLRDVNMMWGF